MVVRDIEGVGEIKRYYRFVKRNDIQLSVCISSTVSSGGTIGLGVTRNISMGGCCVETGGHFVVGDDVKLSVSLPNSLQSVRVAATVRFVSQKEPKVGWIGVKLHKLTPEWLRLVQNYAPLAHVQQDKRLRVLVVGGKEKWFAAQELSAFTGWHIHFATDVATLVEVLNTTPLDALICDSQIERNDWQSILQITRFKQPNAKRIYRCQQIESELPNSGPDQLVHWVLEPRAGLDALLDVLTAELGSRAFSETPLVLFAE